MRVRVEEKGSRRLVGAAETSGELAEWRKLQRKILKSLASQKQRVASAPQSEHLAKTPESLLREEIKNKAIYPNHKVVRWESS